MVNPFNQSHHIYWLICLFHQVYKLSICKTFKSIVLLAQEWYSYQRLMVPRLFYSSTMAKVYLDGKLLMTCTKEN